MSPAIDLRWIVSLSASACHAADLSRRGLAADCALVRAVAQPAEWLGAEVRAAGVDEQAFWDHLLPLAVEIESNRQLVEAVLRKILPAKHRAEAVAARLAGGVADIEAAVARAAPGLVEQISARGDRLRAKWDQRGDGILGQVGRMTDPRVVVIGAKVAAIWPALGGYGSAHLPYNLARLELGEEESPPLPNVIRLAWLLAQLNLDLPAFSESIPAGRLRRLAALAMLPPVLAVSEDVGLVAPDALPLGAAIEALRIAVPVPSAAGEIVQSWWASYVEARPGWNVALAALDQMLEASV